MSVLRNLASWSPARAPAARLGHLVARRDKPENAPVVECAFADGEDAWVRGPAVFVDDDAAPFSNGKPAPTGQLVPGADAGREHHEVGFQHIAVGELQAAPCRFSGHDAHRVLAGMHGHAQALDHAPQHRAAAIVQLRTHEARPELHHMRGESHVLERVGRFKPQQSAAHHHARLRLGAGRPNRVQILNRAVDVAVRQIAAVDWRHERIGARGEHQRIVAYPPTPAGAYGLRFAVYLRDPFAHMHRRRRWQRGQGEVRGADAGEVVAQVNAVVGGPRLVAEHADRGARHRCRELSEAVADHAVANHHHLPAGCRVCAQGSCCIHGRHQSNNHASTGASILGHGLAACRSRSVGAFFGQTCTAVARRGVSATRATRKVEAR